MVNIHLIFSILFSGLFGTMDAAGSSSPGPKQIVPLGVILDLHSETGKVAQNYTYMALKDFYTKNANYQTRLNLLWKDSRKDVVVAASEGNY